MATKGTNAKIKELKGVKPEKISAEHLDRVQKAVNTMNRAQLEVKEAQQKEAKIEQTFQQLGLFRFGDQDEEGADAEAAMLYRRNNNRKPTRKPTRKVRTYHSTRIRIKQEPLRYRHSSTPFDLFHSFSSVDSDIPFAPYVLPTHNTHIIHASILARHQQYLWFQ